MRPGYGNDGDPGALEQALKNLVLGGKYPEGALASLHQADCGIGRLRRMGPLKWPVSAEWCPDTARTHSTIVVEVLG